MLIDDNLITLKSVGKALEMNGYSTSRYFDPLQAVADYDPARFFLVVTDYRMPSLNGIEVLKAIKQKNLEASIIVYTGFPDEKIKQEILENGAMDFYKPLDIEKLIEKIESIKE